MTSATRRFRNLPTSLPFWVISGLLIVFALTGGTSRSDAQSLILLRPISFLACGWALLTLKKEHLERRSFLLFGMLAIVTINLIYLLPLPPEIWHRLPGQDDVKVVGEAVNLANIWRPIAIAPYEGWDSAVAIFAPMAIFLLGFQLSREDLQRLFFVIMGIAIFSCLLGMLQAIDSNNSALYFYRITNTGSAVGIFANRNHSAALLACLFPFLAVFINRSTTIEIRMRRQILAGGVAILLMPIILITGSRSGLILSFLGFFGAAYLLHSSGSFHRLPATKGMLNKASVPIVAGVTLLFFGIVTVIFARAEALNRLFQGSIADEGRSRFWKNSIELLSAYFPLGSGPRSFAQAYQPLESTNTLNQFYLNHAHNDWIETGVAYGLPGILFLTVVSIAYFAKSWTLWVRSDGNRSSVVFARMAGIAIALLGAASITDYPLRTPIFMCVFAILILWFNDASRRRDGTSTATPDHRQR